MTANYHTLRDASLTASRRYAAEIRKTAEEMQQEIAEARAKIAAGVEHDKYLRYIITRHSDERKGKLS